MKSMINFSNPVLTSLILLTVAVAPGRGFGRSVVLEDFDDGSVVLESYPDEDLEPGAWQLEPRITYGESPYSLRLFGNTWKREAIPARALDSGDVWQVAAYIENLGEIHGFGLVDSLHTLFYAFGGAEMLDIDQWVTVYQGAYLPDTWNLYRLPVAEDWRTFFGYLPTITGIVFVNDRDSMASGTGYFDAITDVTEDLPMAPRVQIGYSIVNRTGARRVDVQFYCAVEDTDSHYHRYGWSFGDGATSVEPNPRHAYTVDDDHPYTVLLEVEDSAGLRGRVSCKIDFDPGATTFPIRMNFVGDIMLARRYENPGGVIDTAGVAAIFAPTLPCLGGAADITVANLESPLTDTGTPHPTKPILIRGRPANVAGLAYAGIDVVSLANNHIIDYGLAGMRQTQDSLRANGILFSGAGANAYEAYQPVFRLKNGINIAFLAACNRTGQDENTQPFFSAGYDKSGFAELTAFQIDRQVREVRPNADLVVVETHSGNEYSPVPPLGPDGDGTDAEFCPIGGPVPDFDDIAIRRAAIDAGADLVVNHHPHRLQGFEVYQGKLIAHSLGNFAFDQNYAETFPSLILNVKIGAAGLYDYSMVPIYIDNYIPRRARGELGRHVLDYVARLSRNLGTYVTTDRDSVTARVIIDSLSLNRTVHSHDSVMILRDTAGYWNSDPMRLRRTGSISGIQELTPAGPWQYRLGRDILWFGSFEDEGSAMWLINQNDEYYDTVRYQGSRSLGQYRIKGSGQIVTNLVRRIPCESSPSYFSLYGHLRTDNARNANVLVRYYVSSSSWIPLGMSDLGPAVNGTTAWHFNNREFRSASGTAYFDVSLTSQGPLSGEGGWTWFDNVGIIEWDDWQDWNGPMVISEPNDYYWLQVRRRTGASSVDINYVETDYLFSVYGGTRPINIALPGLRCHPVPFRKTTTFNYNIFHGSLVTLTIYNILGQYVRTLVNEIQSPGSKKVVWNGYDDLGRNVGAGIYFCRLQAGSVYNTAKIILIE